MQSGMSHRFMRLLVAGLIVLPFIASGAGAQSLVTTETEKKIDALLAQMTLEEKIGQLNQYTNPLNLTGPPPTAGAQKIAYDQIRTGLVGSMLNITGAEATRRAQQIAVENSRLKIPMIFGLDVIHGYRTIFPIPLGEAASWDPAAVERSARVAATEAAAAGIHWTFAPMVDIARDARWGRIMEGSGEDPFLGARMAESRVRGFQGRSLADLDTIAACVKHYAAYGFAEAGRDYNTVDISEATLQNVVLPPFKAAAAAGAATFMNSFNEIAGVPATGNAHLQREILKGEWGFNGFVVSDWGSIAEMVRHGFAKDLTEAARLAITAGSDMDMEGRAYITRLADLVKSGKVDVALVDDAVRRVLRVKFALGLFDDPYRYSDAAREKAATMTAANVAAAREVARKSIVLLKNDGVLPLDKAIRTIAVIGPLADDKDAPLGNWRARGEANSAVSLLEGVKAAVSPATRVIYAEGAKLVTGRRDFPTPSVFNTTDRSGFPAAVEAARSADLVLLAIGEDAFQSGEGRSQADIGLKGLQDELLRAIVAVNKKVVVVLMNGRPLTIAHVADAVPAIVEAWLLGSQSGHAIADVLFGDYNPSGRLPVSFPRSVGQEPLYYARKNTGRPGPEPGVTWSHYTDVSNDPLYPFGFGLSYTTFAYSEPALSATELAPDGELQISVTVTNSGARAGTEIVQMYVRDMVGSLTRPIKELKGFERVELAPGQSREVKFTITPRDLAFYTARGRWEAEPGDFKVFVGGNSRDLKEAAFRLRPVSETRPAYLDPARPLDQRVDDLVRRMTLEEKASQMVNHTRAIPRLEVPDYNLWSEALHGVANNGTATVFPQAIGLGATFDAPLVHQMAEVIAVEGRVKYNAAAKAGRTGRLFQGLTFFSPNINIVRDPRWGRGQETYGEDPYLTGRLGVSFITGVQGDDPNHLTAVATAKHYAVHSGPEPLRHQFDARVSNHDLEDTYLPAFRDAVVDGKVNAVMCVYNAVNGIPGCASDFLLNDTLRKQWGFAGFVTGDCNAVDDIQSGHKYVKTKPQAAAAAIKAGTDNDCLASFGPSGGASEYQKYVDAVRQGLVPESAMDAAVKRMMRTRFTLGLFDPPETVKAAQAPDAELDSAEHRALALRLARESIVLLKNDGVLPLSKKPARIAVVGPLADNARVLLGNYNGTPSRSTTALAGIRAKYADASVVFEPGTTFLRPEELVPASALTTGSGAAGLKAEVFASDAFTGAPVETRTDAQVAAGGGRAMGGGDFSAMAPRPRRPTRWTGVLTPIVSGVHVLGVEGPGNKLWIDGKLLVDPGEGFGRRPSTAEIALEKGRKYALKIESRSGTFVRLVWRQAMPDALRRASDAAKQADLTIAVVGITSDLEAEERPVEVPGFKGGDRTSLDLPADEEKLLEAVKATGKPLVVVLMSGSALAVNWANDNANAILQAWYPGEEGGAAIADTIAGDNNPSGRLPVTFYKGVDQLPDFADYSMAKRTYRYFDGQPLYPFGYGLSYSTYSYANLTPATRVLAAGEPLRVEARVTNTSARDGDEVVQLYLRFPKLAGAPRHALRGFTRVHLRAGETQTVKFTLADRDLSYVNEAGTRLVGAGKYELAVGGGQPGTKAAVVTTAFEIKGEKPLPR